MTGIVKYIAVFIILDVVTHPLQWLGNKITIKKKYVRKMDASPIH